MQVKFRNLTKTVEVSHAEVPDFDKILDYLKELGGEHAKDF